MIGFFFVVVVSVIYLFSHFFSFDITFLHVITFLMSQGNSIDANKGAARDDRLQYIRKTQQEVILLCVLNYEITSLVLLHYFPSSIALIELSL